jgi:hypothetical protein
MKIGQVLPKSVVMKSRCGGGPALLDDVHRPVQQPMRQQNKTEHSRGLDTGKIICRTEQVLSGADL